MPRIGNVDQVLLLVRERLQNASKSRDGAPVRRGDDRGAPAPPPLDRARALAALGTISENDRRRLVVRALLAEEFGDRVSSDPSFPGMIDEVLRIIADTPGGPELVERALDQLRDET